MTMQLMLMMQLQLFVFYPIDECIPPNHGIHHCDVREMHKSMPRESGVVRRVTMLEGESGRASGGHSC